MTTYSVDYSVLEQALERAASPVSGAEVHGGLCGVLCAAGGGEQWIAQCLAECEPAERDEIGAMLEALQQETWNALTGTQLEFTPFLPDDESPLDERVDAVALWCHGFLAGLAIGGFRPENVAAAERSDVVEVVRDFAEIAKAALPRGDGSIPSDAELAEQAEEEDSESLMELTEFVRVGVQLVFEYLDNKPPEGSVSATIH